MAEGNRLPSLGNAPHLITDGEFFRISPLQRPHYITSSYTFLFLKKVIFVPHCSIALCLSLLESLRSMVFTPPSFPPFAGDRNPLAKGSSTFLTKPLFPQEREDVTALRCSGPLRYKVGGPQRSAPDFAGWDRLDAMLSIPNLKPNLHESAKSKD